MTGLEFQRLSAVEGLPVNDAVYWVYSSVSEECYAAVYHADAKAFPWRMYRAPTYAIKGVTHYVRMPERI